MSSTPYIWFRGHRMTPAVRDAILAAEQRAGFTFAITQGGFNAGGVAASAGTHDGDAIDLRTWNLDKATITRMVEALRWAGFAAWYRTAGAQYGVRAQGFAVPHVHAVPNGWGLPSAGARRQVTAYRAGRDGLARNLADVGPGHVATWRSQTTPRTPQEEEMQLTDVIAKDDKGKPITVAMALERGLWAYSSQLDGGFTSDRLKRLERPVKDYTGRSVDVHVAAQRGAHAYGAIFSDGWLGKAIAGLRDRISKVERG